jgi:hypothetical protein
VMVDPYETCGLHSPVSEALHSGKPHRLTLTAHLGTLADSRTGSCPPARALNHGSTAGKG